MDTATIISDAIKILGPAIVAAFATYKATKSQYENSSLELSESHRFKAREHLLDYYKSQIAKLEKYSTDIAFTLGQTKGGNMAINSAREDGIVDSLDNQLTSHNYSMIDLHVKFIINDIKAAKRDMNKANLSRTEDYSQLCSHNNVINEILTPTDENSINARIMTLIEILGHLVYCNNVLLEKKIDDLFQPYISKPK